MISVMGSLEPHLGAVFALVCGISSKSSAPSCSAVLVKKKVFVKHQSFSSFPVHFYHFYMLHFHLSSVVGERHLPYRYGAVERARPPSEDQHHVGQVLAVVHVVEAALILLQSPALPQCLVLKSQTADHLLPAIASRLGSQHIQLDGVL